MVRNQLYSLCCVLLVSLLSWGCGEVVNQPEGSREKSSSEQQRLPDREPGESGRIEKERPSDGVQPPEVPPGERRQPPPDREPPHKNRTAFTIPDKDWTETSVRKVLHLFAFGGFASDAQIKTWTGMRPEVSITEILFHS